MSFRRDTESGIVVAADRLNSNGEGLVYAEAFPKHGMHLPIPGELRGMEYWHPVAVRQLQRPVVSGAFSPIVFTRMPHCQYNAALILITAGLRGCNSFTKV